MNAIVALAPVTETFPLADLYLSPLNPRQAHDGESIALLAESLVACGLIQNLSGFRDEAGRVGIVAGGRRLAALQIAVERRADLAFVPVKLATDEDTARIWAVAENSARKDLHPAEEIRAYGTMAETGAPIAAIASAFAVTEAHVRRRLKLATLPTPVIEALQKGEISLGQAAIFTLSSDAEKVLAVLACARGKNWSESYLRSELIGGAIRHSDRRVQFVTLEAYEQAGGQLTPDLFSSEILNEDAELLDRLFDEKLTLACEALKADGWTWAEPLETAWVAWEVKERMTRLMPCQTKLSEDEAEEYEMLAELAEADALDEAGEDRMAALEDQQVSYFTEEQKAHSGGWVYVGNDGSLKWEMGYLRPEDQAAAIEAGVIEAARLPTSNSKAEAPKSPYSAALVADIKAMRLASLQQALLSKPELLLDLLAFHLSDESGTYAAIFDIRLGIPSNVPSVAEGFEADTRLAHERGHHSEPVDPVEAFAGFRAQGKKARNAEISASIARALNYGCATSRPTALFGQIEAEACANIRQVWTPNAANFFGRVSGGYLDALLTQLLDVGGDDERVKAFTKLKKGEKAATMERLFTDPTTQRIYNLTADQLTRIAEWVPGCI